MDIRASIGRKEAILRMPVLLTKKEQKKQTLLFEKWVIEQLENNDKVFERFAGRNYENGSILKVGKRSYTVLIEFQDRKTHSGKLQNGNILLQLSKRDSGAHLQKSIRHLLSRLVGQDFSEEITKKVLYLNKKYFNNQVRGLSFKYNLSNWGSCSSKGNINLSTRLLFAPDDVIDYVIIHELAHFKEMNHSERFWAEVSKAMPDYKEKAKWLKENGHLCSF